MKNRILSLLTVVCLLLTLLPLGLFSRNVIADTSVTTVSELRTAINSASTDPSNPTVINISGVINLDEAGTLFISTTGAEGGSPVYVTLRGGTIARTAVATMAIIRVISGSTLTLDGVVIEGNSLTITGSEALVCVGEPNNHASASKASTLNIIGNSKIIDGVSNQSTGGLYIDYFCTANFSSGIIESCSGVRAGGVYIREKSNDFTGGTLNLNGGYVIGNTSTSNQNKNSGGIVVNSGATLNLWNGSVVENNKFKDGSLSDIRDNGNIVLGGALWGAVGFVGNYNTTNNYALSGISDYDEAAISTTNSNCLFSDSSADSSTGFPANKTNTNYQSSFTSDGVRHFVYIGQTGAFPTIPDDANVVHITGGGHFITNIQYSSEYNIKNANRLTLVNTTFTNTADATSACINLCANKATVQVGAFATAGNFNIYDGTSSQVEFLPHSVRSNINVYSTIRDVSGVPSVTTTGTLDLGISTNHSVTPFSHAFENVTWTIADAGTTNATISANGLLTIPEPGTLTVTATANKHGYLPDYVESFTITVLQAVEDIVDVPSVASADEVLTLNATVMPDDASANDIVWSIKDSGTTGASISGNDLSFTGTGSVVITATITNGYGNGSDYTEDFTISVSQPVRGLSGLPLEATVGTKLPLSCSVLPDASSSSGNSAIFSIENPGSTGASISNNVLSTTSAGVVLVRVVIPNGNINGSDYTEVFSINVKAPAATTETTLPSTSDTSANVTGNSTVATSPSINSTTEFSASGVIGERITLTAELGKASYQWYINRNDGLGYVAIGGATTYTYTTEPITAVNSAYTYYCVTTDANTGITNASVYKITANPAAAAATSNAVTTTGEAASRAFIAAIAIVIVACVVIVITRRYNKDHNI